MIVGLFFSFFFLHPALKNPFSLFSLSVARVALMLARDRASFQASAGQRWFVYFFFGDHSHLFF